MCRKLTYMAEKIGEHIVISIFLHLLACSHPLLPFAWHGLMNVLDNRFRG